MSNELYVNKVIAKLCSDNELQEKVVPIFSTCYPSVAKKMSNKSLRTAACRIAAKTVVNKALSDRRYQAGKFLGTVKLVKRTLFKNSTDFGKGCHTANSEPYFYDASYSLVKKKSDGMPIDRRPPIPIDESGKCHIAKSVGKGQWSCTKECKPISQFEVDAIVKLRSAFDESIPALRNALQTCDDGCPNGHHYSGVMEYDTEEDERFVIPINSLGHPLVCHNDGGCTSTLRILRAASTHHTVLRSFLHNV